MTPKAANGAGLRPDLDDLRRRLVELEPRFGAPPTELLRSVVANVPDYVAVLAPDGAFVFLNRGRDGASVDSILGKSIYDYTYPAQIDEYRAAIERVVRTGKGYRLELEAKLSDGTTGWFETRLDPICDGDEVIALTAISTDVSVRKRSAKALRENELKLRMAVEGAGIGLWSWEIATNTVVWEPTLSTIFGLPPGVSPSGRDGYLALVHPDDRAGTAERIARGLDSGSWEDELRIVRSDGSVRWVMAKASVLRDAHGDLALGAVIDVTERRLRDEQVRLSQKLEAVGQLTAGIAHNFNNMLMGILSNLELALRTGPESAVTFLQDAYSSAERAAALVRQLMTYAGRNRPATRRTESVGPLVERTVGMCRTTFDRRIAFEVRHHSAAFARVDAGQLEQALLNVLINARDALLGEYTEAPRVTIDVDVVASGAPELAGRERDSHAEHVRIRIADNGTGMDAATLTRIYEPFFTTKAVGRGTGLGLATTHAFVREHDGWITCQSAPKAGTTFAIYLPSADTCTTGEIVRAAATPEGGNETVLVIDDEAQIRNVVGLMLGSAGYTAKLAGSGPDAIALLGDAATAATVAAILLDVSMPGMAPQELRNQLRSLAPRARIIYFTGYAFEATDADDAVLEKPVSQATLLGTLREVLDKGHSPRA